MIFFYQFSKTHKLGWIYFIKFVSPESIILISLKINVKTVTSPIEKASCWKMHAVIAEIGTESTKNNIRYHNIISWLHLFLERTIFQEKQSWTRFTLSSRKCIWKMQWRIWSASAIFLDMEIFAYHDCLKIYICTQFYYLLPHLYDINVKMCGNTHEQS